jgi:intraflagellar transport protein 88
MFDPLGEARKTPAPPLAEKAENSPKETAKEMEKLVNTLMEQSAEAASVKHDYEEALRLAKEAVRTQ